VRTQLSAAGDCRDRGGCRAFPTARWIRLGEGWLPQGFTRTASGSRHRGPCRVSVLSVAPSARIVYGFRKQTVDTFTTTLGRGHRAGGMAVPGTGDASPGDSQDRGSIASQAAQLLGRCAHWPLVVVLHRQPRRPAHAAPVTVSQGPPPGPCRVWRGPSRVSGGWTARSPQHTAPVSPSQGTPGPCRATPRW